MVQMSSPWSLAWGKGLAAPDSSSKERNGERKQPTHCLGTGIPTEMSPARTGKCWKCLSGLREEWLQKNSRFSSAGSKSRRSVLGCFHAALAPGRGHC